MIAQTDNKNQQILSLSDLNTEINHEPRLQDVLIAERLGLAQPLNIRQVIEANKEELSTYGEVFTQHVKTSSKGGRPSISYWLNEAQALLLCMFSKTEKAAEVRKAVIDTFMAWRKGQLLPSTINSEQKNALQQAIAERSGDDGKKRIYFWSRFNNHFKIATYKDLPAVMFDVALSYIAEMPDKEIKALPAPIINLDKNEIRLISTGIYNLLDADVLSVSGHTKDLLKRAFGKINACVS